MFTGIYLVFTQVLLCLTGFYLVLLGFDFAPVHLGCASDGTGPVGIVPSCSFLFSFFFFLFFFALWSLWLLRFFFLLLLLLFSSFRPSTFSVLPAALPFSSDSSPPAIFFSFYFFISSFLFPSLRVREIHRLCSGDAVEPIRTRRRPESLFFFRPSAPWRSFSIRPPSAQPRPMMSLGFVGLVIFLFDFPQTSFPNRKDRIEHEKTLRNATSHPLLRTNPVECFERMIKKNSVKLGKTPSNQRWRR